MQHSPWKSEVKVSVFTSASFCSISELPSFSDCLAVIGLNLICLCLLVTQVDNDISDKSVFKRLDEFLSHNLQLIFIKLYLKLCMVHFFPVVLKERNTGEMKSSSKFKSH